MIGRAVAMTDSQGISRSNGVRNEDLGGFGSDQSIAAQSQMGGQRRRQGAACAVGVFGVDAARGQPDGLVFGEVKIRAGGIGQVPPFEQHLLRTKAQQGTGLLFHFVFILRFPRAQQICGFGQIWGDHGGAGQQDRPQGIHRIFPQQAVPTFGNHHRVEHHGCVARLERLGHRLDDLGAAEHTDLDGVDPDVIKDRSDLGCDEIRINRQDAAHPLCVLGGQRGDHGHGIAAIGGDRLEIRLNAGPT